MPLYFYFDEPFSPGTQIDPVDTYTGNGITVTFTLQNKTGTRLSSVLQADTVIYYQFNGGVTKNGNTFTLQSAPPQNSQILAPGVTALTLTAYDQAVVPGGSSTPNIAEIPFYIADISEIHLYKYVNLPQYNGIRVTLVNLVTAAGAQLTWVQLACATAAGTPFTYAPTGQDLFTAPLNTFDTVTISGAAGASSVLVGQASAFYAGDYVIINIGQSTQEIRQIASIPNTNTLVLRSPFDYSHFVSEPVFTCGRKFFMKLTVPINATNNTAVSLRNINIRRQSRIIART